MDAVTYSAAPANLASSMDCVCDRHEPLIITRNGKRSGVMLSLEDFKSLEETAYLLRSPANALRLLSAAKRSEATKEKSKRAQRKSCARITFSKVSRHAIGRRCAFRRRWWQSEH